MSLINSKITSLRFFEVVVPAHSGVINSKGLDKPLHMLPVGGKSAWSVQFDELPKLILSLELENGVTGWGEFYRDHNWAVVEAVAQNLLGLNLNDLVLQDLPIPLSREYDGFETAIWDTYAKCLDIPLYALLGGKLKSKVKVGAWSSHRTIEEIGSYTRKFQDQGYDCIKFKCDLEDNVVGWCQAIKQEAPKMKVILDPNQRWENASESRYLLERLAVVGNILAIEDPLPHWMLQEYARLRQFSSVPIVRHVSLPYVYQGQRPYDAINALIHHAVDGFNFNGGLAKFQQLDAIARTANLSCWHGSEIDLGILEAVYVQKAAAAKSCVWPSDIFGRSIRSHDLLKTPLKFSPPFVEVPTSAGIGVDVDIEVIKKYSRNERHFNLEGKKL